MSALSVYFAVFTFAVIFALLGGGRAERAGAIVLITMLVVAFLTRPFVHARFDTIDPVALADDLFGFAGFAWIGYRARRYWPLCAAALQLLAVTSHFARLSPLQEPWAYALSKSLPTMLVCIALIWGTLAFRRRRSRASRLASLPISSGPVAPESSSPRRWRG